MPRLKTKKAIAKRFKSNGAGAVSRGAACMRHNLRRRSQDMKRSCRRAVPVSSAHFKLLKRCMPYGV